MGNQNSILAWFVTAKAVGIKFVIFPGTPVEWKD